MATSASNTQTYVRPQEVWDIVRKMVDWYFDDHQALRFVASIKAPNTVAQAPGGGGHDAVIAGLRLDSHEAMELASVGGTTSSVLTRLGVAPLYDFVFTLDKFYHRLRFLENLVDEFDRLRSVEIKNMLDNEIPGPGMIPWSVVDTLGENAGSLFTLTHIPWHAASGVEVRPDLNRYRINDFHNTGIGKDELTNAVVGNHSFAKNVDLFPNLESAIKEALLLRYELFNTATALMQGLYRVGITEAGRDLKPLDIGLQTAHAKVSLGDWINAFTANTSRFEGPDDVLKGTQFAKSAATRALQDIQQMQTIAGIRMRQQQLEDKGQMTDELRALIDKRVAELAPVFKKAVTKAGGVVAQTAAALTSAVGSAASATSSLFVSSSKPSAADLKLIEEAEGNETDSNADATKAEPGTQAITQMSAHTGADAKATVSESKTPLGSIGRDMNDFLKMFASAKQLDMRQYALLMSALQRSRVDPMISMLFPDHVIAFKNQTDPLAALPKVYEKQAKALFQGRSVYMMFEARKLHVHDGKGGAIGQFHVMPIPVTYKVSIEDSHDVMSSLKGLHPISFCPRLAFAFHKAGGYQLLQKKLQDIIDKYAVVRFRSDIGLRPLSIQSALEGRFKGSARAYNLSCPDGMIPDFRDRNNNNVPLDKAFIRVGDRVYLDPAIVRNSGCIPVASISHQQQYARELRARQPVSRTFEDAMAASLPPIPKQVYAVNPLLETSEVQPAEAMQQQQQLPRIKAPEQVAAEPLYNQNVTAIGDMMNNFLHRK